MTSLDYIARDEALHVSSSFSSVEALHELDADSHDPPMTMPPVSGERLAESSQGRAETFKEAKEAILERWEREYLRTVLERTEGNMTLAAKHAGIARAHLYRLVKKHGMVR